MASQLQTSRYLLDTNVITELAKENENVVRNYRNVHRRRILIPVVVYAECVGGWINRINSEKNKARVPLLYRALSRSLQIIEPHTILSLSEDVVRQLDTLPRGNPPIGENDRLIAACAMAMGYILVTSDRHFDQLLPQEQIVDWKIDTDLKELDG